ncbi:hypothetical protein CRP3_gp51 [Roseobacter phage CRP-3]|nr:hypothetical protein CRP3_gp51 [Roseobacter phage CRP-3]
MWSDEELSDFSKAEMLEAHVRKKLANNLAVAANKCRDQGIPFNITADDLMPAPLKCPVFGFKLNWYKDGRGGADDSPSIDRLIPEEGYVPGNVKLISLKANRIKNDSDLSELRMVADWVKAQITEKARA